MDLCYKSLRSLKVNFDSAKSKKGVMNDVLRECRGRRRNQTGKRP